MHEALTEALHLARSVVAVRHHRKVGVHAGVPAAVTLNAVARVVVLDIIALAGGAHKGAGAARKARLIKFAFAPGELTLAGLHTGLNLLAKLKDPPPDAALRCAAEAEGVQLSLLSDYDLTGEAPSAAGTLVLGYGSLKDEACASVGETLKKVCMAAREASVTV